MQVRKESSKITNNIPQGNNINKFHIKFGLKPIFDHAPLQKKFCQQNPSQEHVKLITKIQKKFRRNLYQKRKIRELYETEKKYIKALELLDDTIYKLAEQYLSPEQNQMLFGQIKSLLLLHKLSFLPLFQDHIEKRQTMKSFFEGIQMLIHGLNMYKVYSYNYKNAETLIQKLKAEKHIFSQKLDQMENTSEFFYYDIYYLIYYPIARIFHYKNTFQDMVKHQSFLDRHFVGTRQSFRAIKQITSGIDESLESVDFSNDLHRLSKKLDLPSLFQQHRKIDMQLPVGLVIGTSLSPMQFYLVTDLILIHDKNMKNQQVLYLDQHSYCKLYRDSKLLKNCLIIFGVNDCLFVNTQTKDDMQKLYFTTSTQIYKLYKKAEMKIQLQNQTEQIELVKRTSLNPKEEEKQELQLALEANQDKLSLETVCLHFRSQRTIFVIKVVINFYKQYLFLSFTQIESVIQCVQTHFPQIAIPKYGSKSTDAQRKIKFQYILSYLLNHRDIKQNPNKILQIIGLNRYLYSNQEKLITMFQFWNRFTTNKIENPQSVQYQMFQLVEAKNRVFSRYSNAEKESNIVVHFANGGRIKLPYNDTTKVVHILFDIAKAKSMVSFLDFELYAKLPNMKEFFQFDQDNFISKLQYDYSQISVQFFYLKALYHPIKNELIDCKLDRKRQEFFICQIFQEIFEENFIVDLKQYIFIIACKIYMAYLKDNNIDLKAMLKKSALKQIVPESVLQKITIQKFQSEVVKQIEELTQKYNLKQYKEIMEILKSQEKQGSLQKLKGFFTRKLIIEHQGIFNTQLKIEPQRTRSRSLHLEDNEEILSPTIGDSDVQNKNTIDKISQSLLEMLETKATYGYHLYHYKLVEGESGSEELVTLMIKYNDVKLVQKKTKLVYVSLQYQEIVQAFEQDSILVVISLMQIQYQIQDKMQIIQLKSIKDKFSMNPEVMQKIKDYQRLSFLNQ